ncbi:P-loop containing nucleoside triphosphate hydrolase protein [Hypoxylon sp. FL1284]|nr:P-loop containing nucleoside triphosphate hydrolase protein [Hypoxylon sp. FL1284]
MGGVASIPTDPSRRVQVIAAGYPRTGTVSMALALEKLLDGPACHGGTQIMQRHDDYCRLWVDAYKARDAGDKERTLKLVREATAGFVATADMPVVSFMEEMIELYPDAKVVLVTRDPQKWWNSLVALTTQAMPWWVPIGVAPISGWRYIPSFMYYFSRSMMELAKLKEKKNVTVELLDQGGPHILEIHNNLVRELIPKDRLLEMKLSDGWEPLCKFLSVPVPNEPFPWANDAKAVDEMAAKVITRVFQVWAGIFSVAGVGVYSGYWLWKHRMG